MKPRRPHQPQDAPLTINGETGALLDSLSGWIATALTQDLSQPLTAVQANAQAALNTLNTPRPDLSLAREALTDILADTHHLGAMLETLRSPLRQPRHQAVTIPEAEVRAAIRLLTPWLRDRGFNVLILTDPQAEAVTLHPGAIGAGTLLALMSLLGRDRVQAESRQAVTIRALRPDTSTLTVSIEFEHPLPAAPMEHTVASDLHLASCISLVEVLGGRYGELRDAHGQLQGLRIELPLTIAPEDCTP